MEEKRPTGPEQQRTPGKRVAERSREFVGSLVDDWRPPEQQVLQWIRIAVAVGFVLLVVLLILYLIGLLLGITLWNLLKVLAVPITVGAAVPLLNWLQKKRELEVEAQRAQDGALEAYLEQMSQMLTAKRNSLNAATLGDPLSTVARARTLTVLPRLDGARKGSVVQFLYESGLIIEDQLIVDLRKSDLSGAHLSGANLHWAKGWTGDQLSKARSLEDATMPDGQILQGAAVPDGPTFEEWLKSRGRKEDGESE